MVVTITPRFIDKIVDGAGEVVYQSAVVQYCETNEECIELEKQNGGVGSIEDVAVVNTEPDDDVIEPIVAAASDDEALEKAPGIPQPPLVIVAPRVLEERNAYIMRSIMREVITRGTARRARDLGRSDLAGKTGTTNDLYDAWFTGFNSQLVATAWIGYDEQQSMGPRESGGRAALPMWVDYMRVALDGVPEDNEFQPVGIATVRIDRKTGMLAAPGAEGSFFEYFREENMPTEYAEPLANIRPVTPVAPVAPVEPAFTTDQQPASVQQASRPVQPAQPLEPVRPAAGETLVVPEPAVVQPRVKTTKQQKQVDQLF